VPLEPLDIVDNRTPFQKWIDDDGPRARPSYVYIASSWRNYLQSGIVGVLRSSGLEVYDFRRPAAAVAGFAWSAIDPNWAAWTPRDWREGLAHPEAARGFALDKAALDKADCGVLVLPCGHSAHLEAGYLAGRGVPVFTFAFAFEPEEPELMALLLGPPGNICTDLNELLDRLGID
jgi:hypothetical protein